MLDIFIIVNNFKCLFQNEDERNDIISYIKNELNNLTLNPGKYESMVNPIGDALAPVINDEAILKQVVNTIVDEVGKLI